MTIPAARPILVGVLLAVCASSRATKKGEVDAYSAADLAARSKELSTKKTRFSSTELQRYGNHYTMFAYRGETGSAEIHEHEADIFFIQSGTGKLLQGGKIVSPTTTKPGEIRGPSLQGAEALPLAPGAIFHIPAGVPHQIIVDKNSPVGYFVVKVTGQ